jgi:hypothetical protein
LNARGTMSKQMPLYLSIRLLHRSLAWRRFNIYRHEKWPSAVGLFCDLRRKTKANGDWLHVCFGTGFRHTVQHYGCSRMMCRNYGNNSCH